LLHVIEVVSCEHARDVRDRFFAALRMYPVMLPLFRRERLEQREIRFAQNANCSIDLRGSRLS